MKHKLVIIVAIVVITMVVFFAVKQLTTPNVLSKNEIVTQIEKSYQGEILSIVEKQKNYIASFTKEGSVFEVTIDSENGQFSHLTLVQKKNEEQSIEQTIETEPEENPSILTKQQAMDIALKEVPGELDSVEFEKTMDGGNYFVEIEQGDNEIIVQIHAITGKMLSIQYED